jgi:hypothetical protein
VITRYKVGGLAAGSAVIITSGRTADQRSQSTRGEATDVGYNLHGIVTRRVPIELKLCHFTLQTYTLASGMH